MLFLFNVLNHSLVGQRTLEDVMMIMVHQLRALGHEALWDRENKHFITKDRGYNVLVEGFMNDVLTDTIKEHHALGARFLCVATEEPSDKGFNHGIDPEMARRQKRFSEIAPYLDGILHLVPGQHVTDWYAQHAPSSYAELGHAPGLQRFTYQEPTCGFGFFGSLSPRREMILKKLHKITNQKIKLAFDFPTQQKRDEIVRDVKVVLQLRKFDQMGLVSSSRCNTALHLGRPVVAEPHDLCKPWDQVVKFSPTLDRFYMDCVTTFATWRGTHAAQYDRFKTLFPPETSIGEPLRRIGILPSAPVVVGAAA